MDEWTVHFLNNENQRRWTSPFRARADALRDACGKMRAATNVTHIEGPGRVKIELEQIKKECWRFSG
jgi:hypothetical protein